MTSNTKKQLTSSKDFFFLGEFVLDLPFLARFFGSPVVRDAEFDKDLAGGFPAVFSLLPDDFDLSEDKSDI